MIPYPAVLEFFQNFFGALPVSLRAYVVTMLCIGLGIYFIKWVVGSLLG